MKLSSRTAPGEIWYSEFRWLIDHAGWQALPAAPGDDLQGPDVRERIGKDGVVFSAYPIPRGPGVFGRVGLEPVPQWASSTGLQCEISVEELCSELGLDGDPKGRFRLLDSRLEDVKSHLGSDRFARARLQHQIAGLSDNFGAARSVLWGLRAEIGVFRMMTGLLESYVSERRFLALYRQALRSVEGRARA